MPDIGPLLVGIEYRLDPALPPPVALPTMYDLPSEFPGEPGLPDEFHYFQPQLLRETFQPPGIPEHRYLVAQDINLYFEPRYPLWHKRPDWMAVVGTHVYDHSELRHSYVVWQERVVPTVVVELLSPGSKKEDLGHSVRDAAKPPTKWEVYESLLRIPYYIVFGRAESRPQVYRLMQGAYQDVPFEDEPLWIEELGLGLVLWRGSFGRVRRDWLRWIARDGRLIPTQKEEAEAERARAETALQTAQAERVRAYTALQTAEAERARAEAAERRLAALEAELRRRSRAAQEDGDSE